MVHHLGPKDSMSSLSLAYKVPIEILRAHNNIYSDGLLAGRKWVVIPRSHYDGPILSTPPDPEEEERKNKTRRWMISTKCPVYDVAVLYLKGSGYNLNLSIDAYKADEQWEKDNPMRGKEEAAKRRRGGPSFVGQLS